MKNLHIICLAAILLCLPSVHAQKFSGERVYVHTDKDCYISGENVWVKIYVIDQQFQPSTLSKVGYVEICDTEKPYMQLKLALENGSGAGKIKIPLNLPSGTYQLSGYTRYMRNEGENAFFKKQIAIINAGQQPDSAKVEITESTNIQGEEKPYSSGIQLKTDSKEYTNRSLVSLSIGNIPENTGDMVVSVSRDDSIVSLAEPNKQGWLNLVTGNSSVATPLKWCPEYEGHIITGNLIPEPQEAQFSTNIAFVGNNIRYISGQANPDDGTVSFYSTGIYGKQQIVTTVKNTNEKTNSRMYISSPFDEALPEKLPAMQLHRQDKRLMERYIGAQIGETEEADTYNNQTPLTNYYYLPVLMSYDLDKYTRFKTLSETFLEFVNNVRVNKVDGKRRIEVYSSENKRFNVNHSLVFLDGVPVFDHEEILKYNAMLLKTINIYDGQYVFGDEIFEGIVSFITKQRNLQDFQLSNNSQLFEYDCPATPPSFKIPDYSDEIARKSRKPDFRHTLYWNPFIKPIENNPVQLSFYTSDLCGTFKITVEGITKDGKMINETSYFQVKK